MTRLTYSEASDYYSPTWSPDGLRIAFWSDRDDPDPDDDKYIYNIYVMNADGSGVTRLTYSEASDYSPTWSPDGLHIAFYSNRDDPDPGDYEYIRNIYVMNADGSDQTRLTDNEVSDSSPSWSPDGSRIAFDSDRSGNREIYVMNVDGSDQTRLTYNETHDWGPSWSPDGSRIAFMSNRDGEFSRKIYVMNVDGSDQTRLTGDGWNLDPSWSPDGRRIAFWSSDYKEIYVMNADGSGVTRLTDNDRWNQSPSWSPR